MNAWIQRFQGGFLGVAVYEPALGYAVPWYLVGDIFQAGSLIANYRVLGHLALVPLWNRLVHHLDRVYN